MENWFLKRDKIRKPKSKLHLDPSKFTEKPRSIEDTITAVEISLKILMFKKHPSFPN